MNSKNHVAEASACYMNLDKSLEFQDQKNSDISTLPTGYKRTEVGVIPEDWELFQLAAITEPNRPISYGIVQTGPTINGGIPCLRVVDIVNGRINKNNLITTTVEISNTYRRTILKDGDLVIPLRGKVGEIGQVDIELVGSNLTRGVALIALKKGVQPTYVKQFLSSTRTAERLTSSMNGSALQEIPIATLRKFVIAVPLSDEQTAIANALSDVDALINSLEKLIAKKQAIKTATMQQLLTGKTRLPQFATHPDGTPKGYKLTELGEIPEDWLVQKICDFSVVSSGGTPNRENKAYWDGDVPWVTTSLINGGAIDRANEYITKLGLNCSSANWFEAGTLLMAMYGQGKTRGKVGILTIGASINQACAAIQVKRSVSEDFLLHFLNGQYEKIRELSNSGGQENLSGEIIKNILVPIPPSNEQTAIASILSDRDTEIQLLQQRLSKTRQIKQGMMQELLTGKTRFVKRGL